MAISFNQSIGSIADTAGGIRGTITISSNANRALIVAAGAHQAAVGTIQFNGTNMTLSALGTTGFNENAGLWYLNNPPTGAGTIFVNANGNGQFFVGMEFDGVLQSSQPIAAGSSVGTNGTAIGTISTVTGANWIVNAGYSEGSFTTTVNAGATDVATLQAQSFENAGVSYDSSVSGASTPGTESIALASGQRWAFASIVIQPAASAATSIGYLGLMGVGKA